MRSISAGWSRPRADAARRACSSHRAMIASRSCATRAEIVFIQSFFRDRPERFFNRWATGRTLRAAARDDRSEGGYCELVVIGHGALGRSSGDRLHFEHHDRRARGLPIRWRGLLAAGALGASALPGSAVATDGFTQKRRHPLFGRLTWLVRKSPFGRDVSRLRCYAPPRIEARSPTDGPWSFSGVQARP